MLSRYYLNRIEKYLKPGKVFVLYGARQTGKTTLVTEYLKETEYRYRFETGDDIRVQEVLGSQSLKALKEFVEGYDLLVLDEAQRVPGIGLALKMLVDHVSDLRIIATGSASFDLSGKIGEPLTGRKVVKILYPLSQMELLDERNQHDLRSDLEDFLVFGSYPEVLIADSKADKREYLNEIVGSYLLKDILELERVRNPRHLLSLLKLLAFQIGQDVSLTELASNLDVDFKTVARYLDLLEKSFVIVTLSGFSRNLRKEVSKSRRYFFLDNGIRNAVISGFNPLDLRDDRGALWENFVLTERIKRNHYTRQFKNLYFWRTYDRKEIDLIEEQGRALAAHEFKYAKSSAKQPLEFLKAYPGATFDLIHKGNYLDFVT